MVDIILMNFCFVSCSVLLFSSNATRALAVLLSATKYVWCKIPHNMLVFYNTTLHSLAITVILYSLATVVVSCSLALVIILCD